MPNPTIEELQKLIEQLTKERDEYALLIFQPGGETHHNANECPYCKENLNKPKPYKDPYEDKMYE